MRPPPRARDEAMVARDVSLATTMLHGGRKGDDDVLGDTNVQCTIARPWSPFQRWRTHAKALDRGLACLHEVP